MGATYRLLIFLVAVSATLSILDCGSKPADGTLPSVSPSPTPTPSPGPSPGPAAGPLPTDFNVTINYSSSKDSPVVGSTFHRSATVAGPDATWTNACQVSPTEPNVNNRLIECQLEIDQLDLYYNDLQFTFGAPANMCNYIIVYPYWFYQYQADVSGIANGATVSYTVTPTGAIANLVTAPVGVAKVVSSNGTPSVACEFDYEYDDPVKGPNCCEGTYTATVTTQTLSNGVLSSSVATAVNTWTGKWGNCASGPATDVVNWGAIDSIHGLPTSKITDAVDGISNGFLNVLAPIRSPNGPLRSDLWSSNYVLNASLPTAITDFGEGSILFNGHQYYQFVCVDPAEKAIAWINVLVRKWDTQAQLAIGPAGNPALAGAQPPFAPPLLIWFGWDDLITTDGLQYPGPDM